MIKWLFNSRSTARYFNIWLLVIIGWAGPLVLRGALQPPKDISIFIFQFGKAVGYFIPTTFIIFSFAYMERSEDLKAFHIKKLLLGMSSMFAILALTNHWFHNMMYIHEYQSTPFYHLAVLRGQLGWIPFWFVSGLYMAPFPLLAKYAYETGRKAQKQVAVMIFALSLGAVMVLARRYSVGPLVSHFSYEAFTAGMSYSLIGFTLYRYQLFDLTPVARKTAFEEMGEGLIAIDSNLKIADYNAAAEDIIPEITGAEGEDLTEIFPDIISKQNGSVEFADSVSVYTEDNERRVYNVNPTGLESGGDREGHILILNDVTELQEYARDLEQQTEQLDQFASIVSHDLRNPLTVADGRLDMVGQFLEQSDANEDVVGSAETIKDSLQRMDEIIDDALTLAREGQAIEEQDLEYLSEIVNDAWEGSKPSSMDGPELVNDIDPDVQVYADRSRLQTAFENLFRNAVDHGGTNVTLHVGGTESGFYVEDDGPGIPEDKRDDVFEQGFTTGGTGLGLAIVDNIVEAHGWNIRAEEGQIGGGEDGREGGARFVFDDVDMVTIDRSGSRQQSAAD